MNKETRKVIEDLVTSLRDAIETIHGEFSGHSKSHDLAIAAAEKLLAPPVLRWRLLLGAGVHFAEVGDVRYVIESVEKSAGSGVYTKQLLDGTPWRVAISELSAGDPRLEAGATMSWHASFAAAKQHCANHAAASREKART